MIRKKICMLGSYAVGKTSLVQRFVEDVFSDRYETTIGVRILKKQLQVEGADVTLMLWDLHGDDEFQRVRPSYLRGASGYLLVADGTRADTLEKVAELHDFAGSHLGDVPFLLLINKRDLEGEWEVDGEMEERLKRLGWSIHHTSARSGDGVEAAFSELAHRMVRG